MPTWRRPILPPAGRLPRCARPWALLWALLWTLALAPALVSAAAQSIPPLQDIRDETARVAQVTAELTMAATLRETDAQQLAARLAREEETLRARDIDPDLLRTARLKVDTTRERLDTLTGQAAHQRAALARLQQGILTLGQVPDPVTAADPEPVQLLRAAALRLLNDQADALQGLVDALERLAAINARLLTLNGQRLRLIQARVRLDGLGDLADPRGGRRALWSDPTARTFEAIVTEALRAGAQLSGAAAAITGDDANSTARREAMEFRMQQLAVRADLAQNDLELLGIRRRLDGLMALREDPSMPVSLLEETAEQLRQITSELLEYPVELQGERRMLAALPAPSEDTGADIPSQPADLDAALTRQEREVQDLIRRAGEERARFRAAAAQVYAASLTDRTPFPVTAGEWRRIGTGALGLPQLLVRELGLLWQDIGSAAAALRPAQWPGLIGGALLLVVAAFAAPPLLRRRLVDPDPYRRVAAPAAALAAAAPYAAPAALWAWVGERLGLPNYALVPVLFLLGIWPLGVFVLTLAHAALFGPDPTRVRSPARQLFYQRLRWGLILAAGLAALYLLTRSLPVSPLLGDVLDRLAMVALLLLAVPTFGLWGLILHLAQQRKQVATPPAAPRPVGRHAWLLGELSRLIALAMVVAGVLGLLGYANLAWAITSRLGWLALEATLLYFVVVALGELRDHAAARIKGELGDFWRRHFLIPAHEAAVVLAWLTASWGLLRLWGWDAHTPPIRALLNWAERPLIAAGHLSLTPWDLALSVLLVAAAIATGSWVKRVSFQLAYGRVHDRGLRLALATLTQYVVMLCGVLLALKVSGLDLTTLVVFTASLGVGIGFGLQNIVNNFISGLVLLVERPLRVGDIVTVGGHEGEVTRIGIRSLTVRTFDKQEVFIPNGTVISGDFTNWTRTDDILRTVLSVGISYQDDPDQAITLVRDILAGYAPVLRQPAPQVSLWEFGDSAVLLKIEYCVHYLGDVGRTAVRSEVNRRIWYGFEAAGISLPFPQRDLHVQMVAAPLPEAIPAPLPAAAASNTP
ncbi:mechanosensitive ion channel domain-containing protein [uncultured Thiodictyon sp.]|uniref:mechanosensitive ion channel domain-containing protein n=1 Tax=uncultured Thiodictyon sp. TaxID=1846217 RepID=UPI0025F8F82C|nr:mechanosensitive ion channel domain-containing protein [uncultured Thiodictyon sp.]